MVRILVFKMYRSLNISIMFNSSLNCLFSTSMVFSILILATCRVHLGLIFEYEQQKPSLKGKNKSFVLQQGVLSPRPPPKLSAGEKQAVQGK